MHTFHVATNGTAPFRDRTADAVAPLVIFGAVVPIAVGTAAPIAVGAVVPFLSAAAAVHPVVAVRFLQTVPSLFTAASG